MSTQYVRCQFNPWDQRSYTYRNDGDALAIDDRVIVETARGETKVTVVGICEDAPEFECKPILRRAEPDAHAGAEDAA